MELVYSDYKCFDCEEQVKGVDTVKHKRECKKTFFVVNRGARS